MTFFYFFDNNLFYMYIEALGWTRLAPKLIGYLGIPKTK